MDSNRYALTPRTAMLAHYLATMPGHLRLVAVFGQRCAAYDRADERLGRFGMGRN